MYATDYYTCMDKFQVDVELAHFSVTSSEKVDKENRYSDFTIMSLPYPGCEFFRDWKDNGYMAEELMFDWSQVTDFLHLLAM